MPSIGSPSKLRYRGKWMSSDPYAINDVVLYTGGSYVALVANTNVAPSAGATTATWAQVAIQSSGTVANPFYRSGYWFDNRTMQVSSLAGSSMGAVNEIRFVPLFLPQDVPIQAMGIYITSASAAGTARLGAFNADPVTGMPTTVVADVGLVPTTATGYVSKAGNAVLPAGWSWLAVQTFTGQFSAYAVGAGNFPVPLGTGGTTQTTAMVTNLSVSGQPASVFTNNPTVGGVQQQSGTAPLIQFQVA